MIYMYSQRTRLTLLPGTVEAVQDDKTTRAVNSGSTYEQTRVQAKSQSNRQATCRMPFSFPMSSAQEVDMAIVVVVASSRNHMSFP